MDSEFERVIQNVLEKTSLSELISADVALQKRGLDFIGLCPFHQEKTPSFTVSNRRNCYHCFGCGAHGNAISYIVNKHNLPFKEALTLLATRAHVTLPKFSSKSNFDNRQNQKQQLIDIHQIATEYCYTLLKSEKNAEIARKYLIKRRVSPEMIDRFKLGYCDGSLTKYLQSTKKYSLNQLENAGLTINGTSKDRFYHRILFPIHDVQNRPIAFGGRTIEDSNSKIPKYLNSPESEIFHKGYNLYNLNSAIKFVKDTPLIVTEGYMDVISMVSHGFLQSVASLGTALTESQIEILWKYVDNPILCFDGDTAGLNASTRIAKKSLPLLKPGKTLFFCYLPNALDPDELLKANNPEIMQKYLDKSTPLVDVLWNTLIEAYDKKNIGRHQWIPEDKAALKRDIYVTVDSIKQTDIQSLYRQLFLSKFAYFCKQNNGAKIESRIKLISPTMNKQKILGQKILLGILLKNPRLLPEVDELLSQVSFTDEILAEIKDWLLNSYFSTVDTSSETFVNKCHNFLSVIGENSIKVHAAFAFDEEVTTEDMLKRWKEVWFYTTGYSILKEDLKRSSDNFKLHFSERSWQQMKALLDEADCTKNGFD
ncbi:MAG: DNA primase [Holosporales bacterium]|jgi:DNA primase|nr:DNA primase [Holosporales bacterium]